MEKASPSREKEAPTLVCSGNWTKPPLHELQVLVKGGQDLSHGICPDCNAEYRKQYGLKPPTPVDSRVEDQRSRLSQTLKHNALKHG